MGRHRGISGVFGWSKRKAALALHKVPLCQSYRRALRFEPLEARRLLAAGDLDPTFDVDGKLTTDFGSGADVARSVAIQADGKIVVAGSSANGINNDFALARYNTDGSLDTSFSGDGKLTTEFGSSYDRAYDMAIQADGKIIVVGGSIVSTSFDFALARYNTDGSLDTSFSGDGKLTTAIGSSDDEAFGVAIQPDGKIVVAGRSWVGSTYEAAVVRYNTNGSLDTSFSSDGKLTTAIGTSQDNIFDVAIQVDGKIIIAGYTRFNPTYADFALARYNTDGSLDTSFSGDGKLTTNIGSRDDLAFSVAVQSDGKIIVAGVSDNVVDNDFALVRYNTNGTLDTSFSGDGKLTTAIGAAHDNASAVAIQADGKIIVAGASTVGSNYEFALVRYNSNGSLDTSFSGDGKLTTPIGTAGANGNSVALQSDGKIVVAGGSGGNSVDFAVARYEGVSTPPALPGDYNQDNAVDAADYSLWRKTLGTTGVPAYSGADGDGDGMIGQADYGVWRNHFGAGGAGLGVGASGELGVGSGEGGQSRVESQESRAGVVVEGSALRSGEIEVGAQGAMPVSERLAHVAASFQDADGGAQAVVAATVEVELTGGARGALAEPVARMRAVYAAATGAGHDAGLVAWLISRGRERNRGDDNSVDGARGDDQLESSAVLEYTDAVFTALDEPSPRPSLTGRGISNVLLPA